MSSKIEMGHWWTGQAPLGCEVKGQTIKLKSGQFAELGPDEPMGFEVVTVHSTDSETVVKIHDGIDFPMTLIGQIKATLQPLQQNIKHGDKPVITSYDKVFTLSGNAALKLGQTAFYDPLQIEHLPLDPNVPKEKNI